MPRFRAAFLRVFKRRLKQKAGIPQTPRRRFMILGYAVKFRHFLYPRKDTKGHEEKYKARNQNSILKLLKNLFPLPVCIVFLCQFVSFRR